MLLPAPLLTAVHYRKVFGYWTLFRNPETFNERIQHKKLYERDSLFTLTADKISVRDFVAERVGGQYLPKLLQTAAAPEGIAWDDLPSSFVLKANHGSGTNLLVSDKSQVDVHAAMELAGSWLRDGSSYWPYKSWAYKDIIPRLLVEEYLGGGDAVPSDLKLFTFHRKVQLVQVDTSRFSGHRRNLFTPNWEPLAVRYIWPEADMAPTRPRQLEEMISVAERLSEPFEFIRVDMYEVDGRVYVGEMTHYPEAGLGQLTPRDFDLALGRVWASGEAIPARYRA